MKNYKNVFFIIGVSLIILMNYLHFISFNNEEPIQNIELKKEVKKSTIKMISRDEMFRMNSYLESHGKYNVANRYGYLGKYQIGRMALEEIGYDTSWITKLENSIYDKPDTIFTKKDTIIRHIYYFDVSLFPPSKQEEAIKKLILKIERVYLKEHIKKYVGKDMNGVHITKAGILSASFLGFGYVDKFLKSNGKINPSDGNGHTIKDRLKHFEKVEIK